MKKYTLTLLALLFACPFFSMAQKVKKEEASELAKIVFSKYNPNRLPNEKGCTNFIMHPFPCFKPKV